jgi:hypothetical protein
VLPVVGRGQQAKLRSQKLKFELPSVVADSSPVLMAQSPPADLPMPPSLPAPVLADAPITVDSEDAVDMDGLPLYGRRRTYTFTLPPVAVRVVWLHCRPD